MPTMLQTMPASSSFSFSPLVTRWDLVLQLGFMVQRYIIIFSTFVDYNGGLLCSMLTKYLKIFPTNFRARGLNFAASGGSIGSIIASQVWPVGIANIGSKTYFIFMAVNLVCIPIIYLFYPETNGVALEDMDALFKAHHFRSTIDSKDIEDQTIQKTHSGED
jgi:hypothetical protein